MNEFFHVKHKGKVIGKARLAEVLRMIQRGQLNAFHKLSDDGGVTWHHASDLPQFKQLFTGNGENEALISIATAPKDAPLSITALARQTLLLTSALTITCIFSLVVTCLSVFLAVMYPPEPAYALAMGIVCAASLLQLGFVITWRRRAIKLVDQLTNRD